MVRFVTPVDRNRRNGMFFRRKTGVISKQNRWMIITIEIIELKGWNND